MYKPMIQNTLLPMTDFCRTGITDYKSHTFPCITLLMCNCEFKYPPLTGILRWAAAVVWSESASLMFNFPSLSLWSQALLLFFPMSSLRSFLFPACNPLLLPTHSFQRGKGGGSLWQTWEEALQNKPTMHWKANFDYITEYITLNALCLTDHRWLLLPNSGVLRSHKGNC